ncbi:AAA-ATPase [Microbacterium phage Raccoon]|uniref:AAA-ATPase n=4 Tax=Ilzatvirus hamlet TaxID=2560591 RepID=A0A345MEK5_9CAUD|nr:AAA-ATPase [Microbacterium phage Peppino]AUX83249.1 AAA-ATPase [Microbacterium phage Raccoon]AUX83562.1 AAA-ATPase [Microbacterium phage Balsa]AXH68986.1 AAA-ATPase [Microbacterium phage Schnapsidee]
MTLKTIYGRPKVGKTTFALAGAPKGKTAILSSDQGLIGIDTTGFTVVEDTSTKNLNKTFLSTPFLQKHDRIVIDTATSLYNDFLLEIGGGGAVSLNQRGICNNSFAALLRTLRNSKKDVYVVVQEKLQRPDEEWQSDDDDEDVNSMTVPDLSPGPYSILMQMSDAIGRLYIAQVNDKPVRRLWLGPSSSIVAGARSKIYKGNPPYLKQPTPARLNQLLGWTR